MSFDADIGTAPSSWLVPFPRPRFFVGRKAQVEQINAHVSADGGQRLAIYGLGGCGKTALALESVYHARRLHPRHAIFWVSAVSRDSFEEGYQQIASLLGIVSVADGNGGDKKMDVKQQVKERLNDESFGPWLLIVDNADDADVLLGPSEKRSGTVQLIDYLPVSSKGSILFTTRTRATAIKLAESNVIALSQLDKAEAEEVLDMRLLNQKQPHEQETVAEFLEMLSYLALAIVQAVAYINTNDITLAEYIRRYRSSEKDAIELLSEDFEDHGRYRSMENSIATTWFMSFEEIQKHNPAAVDCLSFMACVAHNGT